MVSSRLRYLSLPCLGCFLLKLTCSLASNVETLFPLDFDSMPLISESDTALIQVENTSFWFVELSSLPKVEGTDASVLSSEKRQFQLNAEEAGIDYEERFAFNDLFNGFSISVDPSQLKILSTLPGVKAIFPVAVIERPEYQLIDIGNVSLPHITSALEMTGVKVAVSSLGFTGKGIKVGVMDTGIDVDHPAFGGDGTSRSNSDRFPTERVAYGYDFVGDNFSGDSTPPNPDGFPDDCGGHGTHVAGIIGANDINTGVKGVAPEVIFGAYRVFGCTGSTFADIMLAAMERALADGMDILNMSIGSSFQWPRYPTAEAASRMVEQGMVVVASIGNSGTSGLYAAGAPGVGDEVIGVASVDNANVIMKVMQVDGTDIHFVPGTGSPINPTSGSMTLTRTGTATSTNDACSAFTPDSFTAKAVLIRRGTCSFYSKAKNAENAGASAVVIYNNVAGIGFIGTVAGDPSVNIPVVFISAAEGAQLDSLIAAGSGPVTLTWTNRNGLVANPTGGLISSTSSYGPTPDLKLKPDISAPGGSILSSYPLELGGYRTLSGTSMSSPHVAGAAALLLQARPETPAKDVRSILQNSADPQVWSGNPSLAHLDHTHRQGAGLLDIDDAILSPVVITPSAIAAGESAAGPFSTSLKIKNRRTRAMTFDLSFINAVSTGGIVTPTFSTSDATVSFGASTVNLPPRGEAQVEVTITPATGPTNGIYGGYIILTPQGGGQTLRVPFTGFVGDYQSVVATKTAPVLCKRLDPSTYEIVSQGTSFSMVNAYNLPYVLLQLDHQASTLVMDIYDANNDSYWYRAVEDNFLPRSSGNAYFGYVFEGITLDGDREVTVPDGTYYAKVSILRALGDVSNPSHWEEFTTVDFVIDRP